MSTLSKEEDDVVRRKVKTLMLLMGKKIVDIERSLQINSGGISGWLNGGIKRLSTERKFEISNYLGLKNNDLDDRYIFIFRTTKELLKKYIFEFFSDEGLSIFTLKQGDTTVGILLTRGNKKAIIIPRSPLDNIFSVYNGRYFGSAIISGDDFVKISTADRFLVAGNIKLNFEDNDNEENKDLIKTQHELHEWFFLISKIISTGLTVEDVKMLLNIK